MWQRKKLNTKEKELVIHLKDLHKIYGEGETSVHALRGVHLKIHKGEFVSVMGPSGSGKSTFLHVVGCLHRLTSGSYWLAGNRVDNLNDNELSHLRNREVGIVFQRFNLLPQENIVRNVELPLIYASIPKKERKKRAETILSELGLGNRLRHLPTELSGGQDQRVAIARALVTNPALILADEPTGSLDSKTGDEVMAFFQKLHKKGRTILMVTHDRRIAEFAEKIIHLKDGIVEREEIL